MRTGAIASRPSRGEELEFGWATPARESVEHAVAASGTRCTAPGGPSGVGAGTWLVDPARLRDWRSAARQRDAGRTHRPCEGDRLAPDADAPRARLPAVPR